MSFQCQKSLLSLLLQHLYLFTLHLRGNKNVIMFFVRNDLVVGLIVTTFCKAHNEIGSISSTQHTESSVVLGRDGARTQRSWTTDSSRHCILKVQFSGWVDKHKMGQAETGEWRRLWCLPLIRTRQTTTQTQLAVTMLVIRQTMWSLIKTYHMSGFWVPTWRTYMMYENMRLL